MLNSQDLNQVTDPGVPPLPPHIGIEQDRDFWWSMLEGDSPLKSVFRQTARDMVARVTGRVPGIGQD